VQSFLLPNGFCLEFSPLAILRMIISKVSKTKSHMC
jgi:hypothetical protein